MTPIKTIVEFFWGKKTVYNEVILYPDGSIEFPGYDIDFDALAVDMGDEPTQQCELYKAYTEYGIFGFTLVGKEDYFWASDYFKIESKKAKGEWAALLCRTLGPYMNIEDLTIGEREFAARIINWFAESFEIKHDKNRCAPEDDLGEDGRNKYQSILCKSEIFINGKKCLEFTTNILGSYEDSAPDNSEWSYSYSEHFGDHYWLNITDLHERITKLGPNKYYGLDLPTPPEPYEELEEFSGFSPIEGIDGGKVALCIFYDIGDQRQFFPDVFFQAYKNTKQANDSYDYITKWYSLYRPEGQIFIKKEKNAGDFEMRHVHDPEYGEEGYWEFTEGWIIADALSK